MAKLTEAGKLYVSVISGLLFLLISSPFMYKLTNGLTTMIGINLTKGRSGCPNTLGLAVHTLVFILLTWLLMQVPMKKEYRMPDDM